MSDFWRVSVYDALRQVFFSVSERLVWKEDRLEEYAGGTSGLFVAVVPVPPETSESDIEMMFSRFGAFLGNIAGLNRLAEALNDGSYLVVLDDCPECSELARRCLDAGAQLVYDGTGEIGENGILPCWDIRCSWEDGRWLYAGELDDAESLLCAESDMRWRLYPMVENLAQTLETRAGIWCDVPYGLLNGYCWMWLSAIASQVPGDLAVVRKAMSSMYPKRISPSALADEANPFCVCGTHTECRSTMESCERLLGIVQIWDAFVGEKEPQELFGYKDLDELSHELGIDIAVEAYLSGVPVYAVIGA